MKEHKEHWSALRKKWHQQAHKNEQRFDKSAHILGTIFKKYVFIFIYLLGTTFFFNQQVEKSPIFYFPKKTLSL